MYIQSEIPVAFHHHHHFPSPYSRSLHSYLFLTGWLTGGKKGVYTNEVVLRGWLCRKESESVDEDGKRFTTSEREEEKIFFERKNFFFLYIPKYKHIPCLILQLLLVAPSLTLHVAFIHSGIVCAIINNCIVGKREKYRKRFVYVCSKCIDIISTFPQFTELEVELE